LPVFDQFRVGFTGESQKIERSAGTAFSISVADGANPRSADVTLADHRVNKYNQNIGGSNLEILACTIDGRSGGGLFDEQGVLGCAICNGRARL